ncbi:MAG: glycerate kinase [Desulfatitalea sp. BRH_c12]|nr:MAG: glycerate kinase [Desulfatitalea sp. BRH_c12]
MRADAEAIFRAGLRAVDPLAAVHRACRLEQTLLHIGPETIDLTPVDRILVVGAGKATAAMAQAIEEILSDRISDGLISVKYGHARPLQHIRILEAGHPLPDDNGLAAARATLALVTAARRQDLVIVLLSGGGSALLPLPAPGLSLDDKQQVTDLLLACGADIFEINAVRKHLSAVKGGRLAQAAAPAITATLILSDVVGDNLDVIASGPTVPDRTTFQDCIDIFERYHLNDKLPRSVQAHLQAGAAGEKLEPPKATSHARHPVHHVIVGNNRLALEAAEKEARARGYRCLILSAQIDGEARIVARVHAAIAREVLASGRPITAPACILSGGETTVTVRGNGRGGRNQEFALAAATAIDGNAAILMLCAGTDGTDGPTDAAGAFADHTTVARSRQAGLDVRKHLASNDAYSFFDALGDLLTTGPTGTNVMDLNIVLVCEE